MTGVRASPSRRSPILASATRLAKPWAPPPRFSAPQNKENGNAWVDPDFSCDRTDRGLLGFGNIAGASAGIAQILFYIFLVLLLISLVMHFVRR